MVSAPPQERIPAHRVQSQRLPQLLQPLNLHVVRLFSFLSFQILSFRMAIESAMLSSASQTQPPLPTVRRCSTCPLLRPSDRRQTVRSMHIHTYVYVILLSDCRFRSGSFCRILDGISLWNKSSNTQFGNHASRGSAGDRSSNL